MIRLTPELLDALAAEFVLGTQTPRIRRRMQSLVNQEPALARRVAFWETQLNPLSERARPVPVPPWVWRRIEAALQPAEKNEHSGWWRNLLVWRWTTGLATAMAVLMALLPPAEQRPAALTAAGGVVLVLSDADTKTAWLVSRQSDSSPIKAQALSVPVLTLQQAYELWLLPPGGAPVSLGLLNEQGGTVLQPGEDLNHLLQPGAGMAVSLEPPGGSPTGTPTGPVVYSGSVLAL